MNEAAPTVPLARTEIKLTPAQEARFWTRINKDGPTMPHMESPCWVWMAGTNEHGYGRFWAVGKHLASHRIVWTLANGPIPHDGSAHGICVCHHCDNPACCRPNHLFLGTHTDNVRDKERKGRGNKASGDRNGSHTHPEKMARGESQHLAKLTTTKVIDIRTRYLAGGTTLKQLAAQFGVSFATIGRTIRRKNWKHVP